MTKIIIVEKNKTKKEINIRNFSLENLFKKANLKNNNNFLKRHTWKVGDEFVSVYAKDSGRANNENGYELPPPIDSDLYFGKVLIVKHFNKEINNDNVEDLTLEEWEKIYEKLFGGFEDLDNEEETSSEEEIPEEFKTKEGYSKEDGFIVDDDEEEDVDYIPDDEEEEYDSNGEEEYDSNDEVEEGLDSDELKSNENISDENHDDSMPELEEDSDEDDFDDIGSELSEESYISDYSD
jgi:hypothetical protein